MISQTDIAWLAGVLDGEGNISFPGRPKKQTGRHPGRQIRVSINNTSVALAMRVCSIYDDLGVVYCVHEKSRKRKNGWKKCVTISVMGSKSVELLLRSMLGQLTAKREQAECMLKYLEWRFNGDIPTHFNSHPEWSEAVVKRQDEVCDELRTLKDKHDDIDSFIAEQRLH